MATEKNASADAPAALVAQSESFDLTLDEFCRRLSAGRASPELIGGFHHSQVVAGVVKASDTAFNAAFTRFSKQPA